MVISSIDCDPCVYQTAVYIILFSEDNFCLHGNFNIENWCFVYIIATWLWDFNHFCMRFGGLECCNDNLHLSILCCVCYRVWSGQYDIDICQCYTLPLNRSVARQHQLIGNQKLVAMLWRHSFTILVIYLALRIVCGVCCRTTHLKLLQVVRVVIICGWL